MINLKNISRIPGSYSLGFMLILVWASAIFPVPHERYELNLTAQEKNWLESHPVIRVAPDPYFPPIEWFDNTGTFTGIAQEYASLVEKSMGIRFEIVKCSTWDEVLIKAKNREVDMLSAAANTPKRAEYLAFTEPHLVFPGVIITRNSVRKQLSLKDLNGMKVAIVSGYVWHEYVARDCPKITIDPVPDMQTGLKKVSFGIDDAMIENIATATWGIEKEGITNLQVSGETGYFSRLTFAVRKDWPELRSILDKALVAIPKQEKQGIYNKWIHLQTGPSHIPHFLRVIILGILIGVTFLIALFLLWNRSLHRTVDQRTRQLRTELDERSRVEAALRESESRFLEMVENANSIILKMDLQGRVLFFNAFACKFFGFTKEEILGKSVVGTIVPEIDSNGADLAALIVDIGRDPRKYSLSENENMRKDGSRIWVSWSNKPIYDKQGNLTEVLSVGNDISEIKRIQEAFKSERDFANAIFETSGALVVVLDQNGKIVRFNKTCELATGYQHEDVLGKLFGDLFLEDEEKEQVMGVVSRLIQGDFPNKNENHWKTKAGGKRLIEWYNSCLLGKSSEVEYIISTGIDITEHRKAEIELDRYRKDLEKLVATRTEELTQSVGRLQTEVGERKQAEEALRESERRYRYLFDESPAGSLIIGTDGKIKAINRSFLETLGYAPTETIGHGIFDFVAEEDR
jgi:PAS domain S-box-containing protein